MSRYEPRNSGMVAKLSAWYISGDITMLDVSSMLSAVAALDEKYGVEGVEEYNNNPLACLITTQSGEVTLFTLDGVVTVQQEKSFCRGRKKFPLWETAVGEGVSVERVLNPDLDSVFLKDWDV